MFNSVIPSNSSVDYAVEQTAIDFYQLLQTLKSFKFASNQLLTSARYEVLSYLRNSGAQSLSSISEYRKVTNATMSKIVASLIEDDLIIKASSKIDKRSKLFFISRKAKDLLEHHDLNEVEKIQNSILGLTLDEQDELKRCLSIIRKLIR